MTVLRSSDSYDTPDTLSVMLGNRLASSVSRSSDVLTPFRAIGEALSIKINLSISVRCHNISLSPVFKRLLRMTDMSDARQMFSAYSPLASPKALAHTGGQVLETPRKALPRNVIAVFLCLIGFAPMGDGPVRKAGRTTFCVFRTSPAIAFESSQLPRPKGRGLWWIKPQVWVDQPKP